MTEYLIANQHSIYTFFGENIYEQLVKAKLTESTVELINSKDFFNNLTKGIVSDEYLDMIDETKQLVEEEDVYKSVREDLKDFLCLDTNYRDLFLIKKLTRFIDEVANKKELRDKALAVLPSTYNLDEGEEGSNFEMLKMNEEEKGRNGGQNNL